MTLREIADEPSIPFAAHGIETAPEVRARFAEP
jgi:hypothetical protein